MSDGKITLPARLLKEGDVIHITAKGTITSQQSFPVTGIEWVINVIENIALKFPGITEVKRTSPNGIRIYYADGYSYPEVAEPIIAHMDNVFFNGLGAVNNE